VVDLAPYRTLPAVEFIRDLIRSWWRLVLVIADATGYVVDHAEGVIVSPPNAFCRRALSSPEGFRRCNDSVRLVRDELLSRGRRVAVKSFLLDSKTVVGIGNIYASEALHHAGIDPRRAAGRIALDRYRELVVQIRDVLSRAIDAGGTTLRDFVSADGRAGHFEQQLSVYGRDRQSCERCGASIRLLVIGQRSTYFCGRCQR